MRQRTGIGTGPTLIATAPRLSVCALHRRAYITLASCALSVSEGSHSTLAPATGAPVFASTTRKETVKVGSHVIDPRSVRTPGLMTMPERNRVPHEALAMTA